MSTGHSGTLPMPELHVVSWQDHGAKRWLKPFSYAFAAGDQLVALGLAEVPRAAMVLPLAFAKSGGSYLPVAVLGFKQGHNLVVSADGRWLPDYVPLFFRSHPFRLARNADGNFVLCVIGDSGLITDGPAGNRFYDDERKPTPETSAIGTALLQLENDKASMLKATAILAEHDAIEPWPFRVQEAEGIKTYENVYRVNESKLNQLPADALAALRNSGGLVLAYAQLLSMQHLPQLAAAAPRSAWGQQNPEPVRRVAALNIVDDNGTLSFAHL